MPQRRSMTLTVTKEITTLSLQPAPAAECLAPRTERDVGTEVPVSRPAHRDFFIDIKVRVGANDAFQSLDLSDGAEQDGGVASRFNVLSRMIVNGFDGSRW